MEDEKNRKAVTILIVFFLPLLFILIYAGLSRALERENINQLNDSTKNSATLINYTLRYFGFSTELASSLSKSLDEDTIREMIQKMSAARLGGLMVLRIGDEPVILFKDGNLLYADKNEAAYYEWVKALSLPAGKTRYLGPLPSLIGNSQEMLAVTTVDNEVIGKPVSLALRLPLKKLLPAFSGMEQAGGKEHLIFLATQRGEIISCEETSKAEFDLDELGGIVTSRSHELAAVALQVTLTGRDYLVCKAPIPDTDWSVLAVYPEEALRHHTLGLMVGLSVAWFCLTVFVILLFYQARRFGVYKILSEHDHLTGLGNRLAFEKDFRSFKTDRDYPFSLVMIDIDGLKLINDALGHSAGDSLLRRTSMLLQDSFRESDFIYRMGGDEFSIILPDTRLSTARILLERLEKNAEEMTDRRHSPIFFSFGVAEAKDDESFGTVSERADGEMYEMKEKYRSQRREKIKDFLRSWFEKKERRGK